MLGAAEAKKGAGVKRLLDRSVSFILCLPLNRCIRCRVKDFRLIDPCVSIAVIVLINVVRHCLQLLKELVLRRVLR